MKGIMTFLAAMLLPLFLNGCFYCSDHAEEENFEAYTFIKTKISFMDSLENKYVAQKKWSSYDVENKGSLKENYSKNTLVYDLNVKSSDYERVTGAVFKYTLYACTPDDDCDYNFVDAEKISSLYLEFYGCDNYTCRNTNRIVVHDADYRYVKSFDKSQFSIAYGGQFGYEGDGDCTIYKNFSFRLIIDDEDFKIDWIIKDGRVVCKSTKCQAVTDYSVWG